MLKEMFSNLENQYRKLQEENNRYQELLKTAFLLPSFVSYSPVLKKELRISFKPLMGMCSDLNSTDAVLIRGLIPIDEVILSCLYAIECKSNVKFYFVATSKYLWLVHKNGYLKYRYSDLFAEVVKKGILSEVLLLGNMLFEVHGLEENISSFVLLFQDGGYRQQVIAKELEIFCGSVPCLVYLNDLSSGISIGQQQEIVFHTSSFHYKYLIADIKNYELLLDDMVIREKKSLRRGRLTANKNGCYEMSIRVTTSDKTFLLPILLKNAFTSFYAATSVEFMENKAFSDRVIDLLDTMEEDFLNGEVFDIKKHKEF